VVERPPMKPASDKGVEEPDGRRFESYRWYLHACVYMVVGSNPYIR
jgi:hypothetical protein